MKSEELLKKATELALKGKSNSLSYQELIKKAAYLGNEKAQFELGQIYENQNDFNRSKYWYEKACARNYAEGCVALSFYYSIKPNKNSKRELALLQKAHKLGNQIAAYNIALYYKNIKNHLEFKKWIEKSIERWPDNGEALFELGVYYYEGRGGKKLYRKSYELFLQALKSKSISFFTREQSLFYIAKMYFSGYFVQKSLGKAKYLLNRANVDNDHFLLKQFLNQNEAILSNIEEEKVFIPSHQ